MEKVVQLLNGIDMKIRSRDLLVKLVLNEVTLEYLEKNHNKLDFINDLMKSVANILMNNFNNLYKYLDVIKNLNIPYIERKLNNELNKFNIALSPKQPIVENKIEEVNNDLIIVKIITDGLNNLSLTFVNDRVEIEFILNLIKILSDASNTIKETTGYVVSLKSDVEKFVRNHTLAYNINNDTILSIYTNLEETYSRKSTDIDNRRVVLSFNSLDRLYLINNANEDEFKLELYKHFRFNNDEMTRITKSMYSIQYNAGYSLSYLYFELRHSTKLSDKLKDEIQDMITNEVELLFNNITKKLVHFKEMIRPSNMERLLINLTKEPIKYKNSENLYWQEDVLQAIIKSIYLNKNSNTFITVASKRKLLSIIVSLFDQAVLVANKEMLPEVNQKALMEFIDRKSVV